MLFKKFGATDNLDILQPCFQGTDERGKYTLINNLSIIVEKSFLYVKRAKSALWEQ
jgi:hypothetical protein